MRQQANIQVAEMDDLDEIRVLRQQSIQRLNSTEYSNKQLKAWASHDSRSLYRNLIGQQTLLVSRQDKSISGCAGLEPSKAELLAMFIHPDYQSQGLGYQLVEAVEALAASYLLDQLSTEAVLSATDFYANCGYIGGQEKTDCSHQIAVEFPVERMHKNISGQLTGYQRHIMGIHQELGINSKYAVNHQMRVQHEADSLQCIGLDCFDREQHMLPDAAQAWFTMQRAAQQQNIVLQPVSAYRSVDYQSELIQRKLDKGQLIESILQVSAAPGFSEHHTGCAIDITCPGSQPLEEEFERTAAFAWLQQNAAAFGFRLSFPRYNRYRIAYEPWHWYYSAAEDIS